MTEDVTAKLAEIFRVVFDLPPDANVEDVRQINTQKWDSMAHMSLVSAVESEFNISIDAADALQMTSFQATELLLESKLR
jgi:acyl carrier protein